MYDLRMTPERLSRCPTVSVKKQMLMSHNSKVTVHITATGRMDHLNRRQGEWVYIGRDGRVKQTRTFVDGVREGPYKLYFMTKEHVRVEGYYTAGKRSGKWKIYSRAAGVPYEITYS
jgi:antitoxin component YwqK of YwqJK toxin-antitoxin module